ncbi:MAG: fibronectin type III domain-containing protein [Limisphaerales bacterium]
MDSHWLSFGLNRPGAKQRPPTPQNVTAVLVGTNAIAVKWANTPRAERYRVWRRIVDQEPALVPIGSPADLDYTMEGLPSNSLIEIAVSAINNGGESATSTPIPVMTT